MKIDFHTHFSEEYFRKICTRAKKLDLDALVMTNLPANSDIICNGISVFPSQEVEWIAASETKKYEDFLSREKGPEKIKLYRGKAMVLLPSHQPFLKEYDIRLYQLLEQVNELSGVTIALQDDENLPIALAYDKARGGYLYAFDGIRIRPYNSHDINSELSSCGGKNSRVAVTGSNASTPGEIGDRTGYTEFPINFESSDELIKAIRNKIPSKLYVFQRRRFPFSNPRTIPLKDTVKPLKIIIPQDIISGCLSLT